jgi:aryl-alcohol dehydrogenase-like predicted oxidoreductase
MVGAVAQASVASIKKAHAVHPISAVQSEYSLLTREVENDVLPACRELGIAFVPFSPLARGLMTNTLNINELGKNDFRKKLPRYQQEYQENNEKLSAGFAEIATEIKCSPAQLALAWILAQGENIIPIPGTKKRKNLIDNAGCVDVLLSQQHLNQIGELLKNYPDTGDRYDEASKRLVDKG